MTFSHCFYPLWAEAFPSSLQSRSFAAICARSWKPSGSHHLLFCTWWTAPSRCTSFIRTTSSARLQRFEPAPIIRELFRQIWCSLNVRLTYRNIKLVWRARPCFLYTCMFTFYMTFGHLKRQSVQFSVEHSRIVCGMLTGFSSTFMTLRVGSTICVLFDTLWFA